MTINTCPVRRPRPNTRELKAVTFTATQGPGLVRGLLIDVTDEMGVQSPFPGIALVMSVR